MKANKLVDSLLPSESEPVQKAWLELQGLSKELIMGQGYGKVQSVFIRLNSKEKQNLTKFFNKIYGFNFTVKQFTDMVYYR